MYNEKIKPILEDLENKEIEIAGGSVVGMVLGITNSLVKYICNLTIGKKKYQDVQDEVLEIKKEAEELKQYVLEAIDKDKEMLEEILKAYKTKKENPKELENACKKSVEFCLDVTQKALQTLKLTEKISKVGNKMLASDFKVCCYYSFASVQASIVNVKINLDSLDDEKYIEQVEAKYKEIYNEAKNIYTELTES